MVGHNDSPTPVRRNGASLQRQKLAISMLAQRSTFRSHAQSATRFWRKVLRRSIAGSRIQAGSRFKFEAKMTSNMQSGSCGCHICGTR